MQRVQKASWLLDAMRQVSGDLLLTIRRKEQRTTPRAGTTTEFLRDEYGFEAFYNFAITPWLQLTPDIQVIRPAQKETISGENVHTATVLALRLQMLF